MKEVILMENYDSMVFYASWYQNADAIGKEFRDKMLNQLIRYGLFGEIPDNSDDPIADMMFKMAKPNIDSNIKKKIDGRKGGRKPGGQSGNTNAKKRITSGLSNGNVNVNGNVNANDNDNANVNGNGNVNDDASASASATLEAGRSEPGWGDGVYRTMEEWEMLEHGGKIS